MELNRISAVFKHGLFGYAVTGIMMFFLGYFISSILKSEMEYKNEISLADILNISITALVTIGAAWYITKRLNEDRYAKELAIEDLKEIEHNITSIVNKVHAAGPATEILLSVHQLNILLNRLDRTCKVNGKNISVQKVKNHFNIFYRIVGDIDNEEFDNAAVLTSADNLIMEVRETILKINQL